MIISAAIVKVSIIVVTFVITAIIKLAFSLGTIFARRTIEAWFDFIIKVTTTVHLIMIS